MFYKGVVEDNNDDKQLGRVKVRIIGKHTSNKNRTEIESLPKEDLPYAYPIFPLGGSSISGVCNFAVPEINSVVVCGYFDVDEQELFYIGTMGLLGDTQIEGFGDENSVHPKKKYPLSDLVNSEDDVYENQLISNNLFDEPQAEHKVVYPNNKVIETPSGHIIELDDSDGTERIRIRHRTGSFTETHNDGTNVEKIVKDKYLISENLNIHTNVNCNLYCTGEINVECENDTNLTVGGNVTAQVSGNVDATVEGNTSVDCTGNITLDSGVNVTVNAPRIDLNP